LKARKITSFGGFDKQGSAPFGEINTTMLVDVMLVLLIIFIVAAPLITNTALVILPCAKSKATTDKPTVINVSINSTGQLFFNGRAITKDDLAVLLSEAVQGKAETELRLQADRDTRYQEITEIMAEAQKA